MKRFLKYAGLGVVLLLVALFLVMGFRSPSHERNWKPEYAVLPDVKIDNDTVQVKNFRDFRFGPGGNVLAATFENRSYGLSNLKGVWYGISHFHDFGLAHTFLSFEFEGREPLVVSVEARMEVGESYHPVTGQFRNYELIYMLTSERDTIGTRTHVRGERVYLYRIEAEIDKIQLLFKELMARVNEIHAQAEFYNTLTDNCTTSLFDHAKQISLLQRVFEYRILLPGFSDELLYEMGLLKENMSFNDLQKAALLDPSRTTLEDPDFSRKIRDIE